MAAISGVDAPQPTKSELSRNDQTLLLFAGLMEGGKEDDETIHDLDRLTKLLNDDVEAAKKGEPSICALIDPDCVDTLVGYLDMRQPDIVRGHATLTVSSYLKAAGEDGASKLSSFFYSRVKRGTYDDYILAFCVAATIFPIVPDLTAEMFLSEGFLPSLGPLMRRKWKSRKVETACLDMLNVACMNATCRDAVKKYCSDWLEEIVDQDPDDVVKDMFAANPDGSVGEGSISMRRHSRQVQNLAAVILAKIKATLPPQQLDVAADTGDSGRIQPATTSIEDLSKMFTDMLVEDPENGSQNSVEGLAYASLQPTVKEKLAEDAVFLKRLVKTLQDAPPRSPLTYGALSIFANLTRYQPPRTEEQKRLDQLKAYANAAGKSHLQSNPLEDEQHVAQRGQHVFDAGVTPVLVTHSKNGSIASLGLIVSIIHALSVTPSLRGQLAQQGAVRLLIDAWTSLSAAASTGGGDAGAVNEATPAARAAQRTAAQALARILITTNPTHVFGGTRPTPISAAIRPLASLLRRADDAESYDLLPTFEALMALTNLASTDDDTRRGIIRAAWPDVEEQILSNNARVTRAAVELVCNLVQGPDGVALYADVDGGGSGGGSGSSSGIGGNAAAVRNRLNILVALADAEDAGTRSAAAGALASLLSFESVVRTVVARERGVKILLGLCAPSESEDLRHRGAVAIYSMAACDGETGKKARKAIRAENGEAILKDCARASRRQEVVEVVVYALKVLLEEK
ncbi:Armadillo-type fold protein [Niveomyces insectorum RCEF 264]|uniref:Armadillo-type fold protein n=1 Tax=Niveomyces insectorum RCEF 264 TaxID=1081102 RepID=A0A167QBJ8_9HYPO|nr:Armadillo-type fold protein [Niveomyces insectorum RCEF 264]